MKARLSPIPLIVVGSSLVILAALYFGWLRPFFFGADHATVQGIDFFAVPKSYLNLLEGRSAFDTWGGKPYGPYATWYLAHPAFSVFVASWFSFFPAWTAYWLFVLFSMACMAIAARFLAVYTSNPATKRSVYLILLCSFPTIWLYYVGNMHAPLVLALCLLFAGLMELTDGAAKRGRQLLTAGLLISLFSKPIVLLMLPLLLLLKETRKSTLLSLLIYVFVSLLFLTLPFLNPQSIGLAKVLQLAGDPAFVQEHMNIFKNQFVLNEYMKDNSIHWLNLMAQSDYKLMHIDVFSLPVFIDTVVGHATPSVLYKLPILICLLFSMIVPFLEDRQLRLESSLLLLMAISLTFFLSYNTVWEYQYSSALPIVALLPVLNERKVFFAGRIRGMFLLGLLLCLPSIYFLVRNGDYQSVTSLSMIRLDRVIPVVVLFCWMCWEILLLMRRHFPKRVFLDFWKEPGRLFFN